MDALSKSQQRQVGTEQLYFPRGQPVGGSSTINADHNVPVAEVPADAYGAATKTAERPSKALEGSVDGKVTGLSLRMGVKKDERTMLTEALTHIAAHVAAEHHDKPFTGSHPLLEKLGEHVGKFLGVVVTEALALVPSWNTPVLDANGKPVEHVDGADRLPGHDILKRHQEVVGPKIAEYVKTLSPGAIHDLLEGMGKGASAAPGDSYRLEAEISDMMKRLFG